MKKFISLSLLALVAQAASASIILQYDFNEDAGAVLGFTPPRPEPTIGAPTELWGPNVATSITNGAGQLANTATFSTTSGITLASPILANTGTYEIAYNGVAFNNLGTNDFITFGFMAALSGSPLPESGPSPSSSARGYLKFGNFDGAGSIDFSYGPNRDSVNHSLNQGSLASTYNFVIELDTDAKELSFFYDAGDGRVQIGTTLTGVPIGTTIGSGADASRAYQAIAMRGSLSDGASILIDQITVSSVIPEPTTYALLGGLLVVGLTLARRRR